MTDRYIIIVAGGSGHRMGGPVPKQFLPLKGKPVLMHTLERFYQFDPDLFIILVIPDAHKESWDALCKQAQFSIPHRIVFGGETRFHSVSNGLQIIEKDGIVGIHDGVRPLVSLKTIETCFREAEKYHSAIPATEIVETVRSVHPSGSAQLDRSVLRIIQTPQVFRVSMIKDAFLKAEQESFTDDAGVFEHAGYPVHLVQGNRENIKITTPQDLKLAEILMSEPYDTDC
jgi:2-C-methyl-D-erythritol 4-phosphate cytidylyltransferase